MSEQDKEFFQQMWRTIVDTSQRLEKVQHGVAGLNERLGSSDRLLENHIHHTADSFVRIQSRIDELRDLIKEGSLNVDRRFERVEARLDAIDGRLLTLNATVTLHELKLREAK